MRTPGTAITSPPRGRRQPDLLLIPEYRTISSSAIKHDISMAWSTTRPDRKHETSPNRLWFPPNFCASHHPSPYPTPLSRVDRGLEFRVPTATKKAATEQLLPLSPTSSIGMHVPINLGHPLRAVLVLTAGRGSFCDLAARPARPALLTTVICPFRLW